MKNKTLAHTPAQVEDINSMLHHLTDEELLTAMQDYAREENKWLREALEVTIETLYKISTMASSIEEGIFIKQISDNRLSIIEDALKQNR